VLPAIELDIPQMAGDLAGEDSLVIDIIQFCSVHHHLLKIGEYSLTILKRLLFCRYVLEEFIRV
jgi:hypothetical protein